MKVIDRQLAEVLEAKRALARKFKGDIDRLGKHLMAQQEKRKRSGRFRYVSQEPTPPDSIE